MDKFNTKWTREDKNQLTLLYKQGLKTDCIAKEIGRTEKSIISRLEKLGLKKVKDVTGSISSRFGIDGVPTGSLNNILPSDVVLINKIEYKQNAQKTLFDLGHIERSLLDAFYFVYFIVNTNHDVYIGCSQDVIFRIHQHNKNFGGKTTSGRGPWYPFSILCVSSKAEALTLEARAKKEFCSALLLIEVSLKEVLLRIGIELELEKIRLLEESPDCVY